MILTRTDIMISPRVTDPETRMVTLLTTIAQHKGHQYAPDMEPHHPGLSPAGLEYLALLTEARAATWRGSPESELQKQAYIVRFREIRPRTTDLDRAVVNDWDDLYMRYMKTP